MPPKNTRIRAAEDLKRYKVGGAVRDRILGIRSRDADWVVVGATPDLMLQLGFKKVGKEFPVYLHPESKEEYALARRERKVGRGYKGFEVDVGGDVTLEDDLMRRDLTINAMAETPDGVIIDPYGGRADIEKRALRHVSSHFSEDPLRILRVARFAAQLHSFGFAIDAGTFSLMKEMVAGGELADLTAERVWREVQTALTQAEPSIFFSTLHECGSLVEIIPEFEPFFSAAESEHPAVSALDRAARLTDRFDIRFAVLAYYAGSAETDCADSLIKKLCARLRTPAYCRLLSLRLIRHLDDMAGFFELSADSVVRLISRLDGLRNRSQLQDFVVASEAIARAGNLNDDQPCDAGSRLIGCRDAMTQVDGKSLAARFRGEKLRQRIVSARVSKVAAVLGR